MKTCFQTGRFRFAIECPPCVGWQPEFDQFTVAGEDGCITYQVIPVEQLPVPQGVCILRRQDVEIWRQEQEELRFYRLSGLSGYYAVKNGFQILILESHIPLLNNNRLLFSLLGLEQQILDAGGLLLHCSFIEYQGQAILFTGPSGIGKSTQADLWAAHRGAKVVNGDRALLCRTENGWEANGWPFSGSSPFCENARAPIRAIVSLSQRPENNIRFCEVGESLKILFSQVTINRWNWDCTDSALLLIQDLCTSVPMWSLGCRKDETAVACLERTLGQEKGEAYAPGTD